MGLLLIQAKIYLWKVFLKKTKTKTKQIGKLQPKQYHIFKFLIWIQLSLFPFSYTNNTYKLALYLFIHHRVSRENVFCIKI